MCKLISHVHTLAFSFVNIICVSCIDIFSLLYSIVLCIIYVNLYYVLFLLEEIKNYYYDHQIDFFSFKFNPEVRSSSEMFVITKWTNQVLFCLGYLVQINKIAYNNFSMSYS